MNERGGTVSEGIEVVVFRVAMSASACLTSVSRSFVSRLECSPASKMLRRSVRRTYVVVRRVECVESAVETSAIKSLRRGRK